MKGPVKNPVRHPVINGMKYCMGCCRAKEAENFSVNCKKHGTLKPTCKKCTSEKSARVAVEAKMKERPYLYAECSECGKIYYKNRKHKCEEKSDE